MTLNTLESALNNFSVNNPAKEVRLSSNVEIIPLKVLDWASIAPSVVLAMLSIALL